MSNEVAEPIPAAEKERQEALASLNQELRKIHDHIQKKRASALRVEIISCYEIGSWINQVRGDEQLYGHGAVRRLAISLGWGDSEKVENLLGDYQRLAAAWSREELDDLLPRKNVRGQHIGYQ